MVKYSFLIHFFCAFSCFFCCKTAIYAQRPTISGNTKGAQMSEQEIKLQERFIDATREKILDNFEKADSLSFLWEEASVSADP